MRGLRQAVAFLTRVPMGETEGLDQAAGWFPLVGALIGVAVAGAYAVLYAWVPSLLAAIIAIGLGVLLTGAFHEDGLADSFDAIGSGARGEEALRIMGDSRLGTHGTSALVFSFLWRIFAVASLTPEGALAGLTVSHTLGRAGAVVTMATTEPARPGGLGRSGVAALSGRQGWFAMLSGLAISLLSGGRWVVGLSVAVVALVVVTLRRIATRRIGGITGDILGACEQLGEMGVLAVVAAATWRGWDPWWVV